jgi:hypothetical protein
MRAYLKMLERQATFVITPQPTQPPRYVAIEDQICDWFKILPPAQRQRPFSLAEIVAVAHLRGRYRDKPHPMNVGAALRKLNFRSGRDWSAGGRGTRVWFPPEVL